MLWLPVYNVIPGTSRALPAVAPVAWQNVDDWAGGRHLFTAETTAVYWTVDDKQPDAIAGDGFILPRDDSMILELEGRDVFWFWIPAGGILRHIQLRD